MVKLFMITRMGNSKKNNKALFFINNKMVVNKDNLNTFQHLSEKELDAIFGPSEIDAWGGKHYKNYPIGLSYQGDYYGREHLIYNWMVFIGNKD